MSFTAFGIPFGNHVCIQFAHGSLEQFRAHLTENGIDEDTTWMDGYVGARWGNIIWISNRLKIGSIDFIKTLIHECGHFADYFFENDHALVVSELTGQILSKCQEEAASLHNDNILEFISPDLTGAAIQPRRYALPIFSHDIYFLHSRAQDCMNYVRTHMDGDFDHSSLADSTSALISDLIWVSDDIHPASVEFIQAIAHGTTATSRSICEACNLEGTEARAYIAEYLTGMVLADLVAEKAGEA